MGLSKQFLFPFYPSADYAPKTRPAIFPGRVFHGWGWDFTSLGNREGATKIAYVFLPQPLAEDVIEPHVLAVHHEFGVQVLAYLDHGEEDNSPALHEGITGIGEEATQKAAGMAVLHPQQETVQPVNLHLTRGRFAVLQQPQEGDDADGFLDVLDLVAQQVALHEVVP
jgi:hypothetical protein